MSAAAESPKTDYAIETEGLTRRFGDFTAVDNVTLKIPKGQLYGFLGLNGAGRGSPEDSREQRYCREAGWFHRHSDLKRVRPSESVQ